MYKLITLVKRVNLTLPEGWTAILEFMSIEMSNELKIIIIESFAETQKIILVKN